jgi:multiple sugar transport system ATP-binding protein
VRVRKASNGAAIGRVRWIEHLGDQNHLHVAVGEHDFVTLTDPAAPLAVDDAVCIDFLAPLYFDRNGLRLAH